VRHSASIDASRAFDLTRDGFTLLVMGWAGDDQLVVKIRQKVPTSLEQTARSISTLWTNRLWRPVAPTTRQPILRCFAFKICGRLDQL
jgi:hypothetical protein